MKIRKILKSGFAFILSFSLLSGSSITALAIEEEGSAAVNEQRIEEIQAELEPLAEEDAIIANQLIVVTRDSDALLETVAESAEDTVIDMLDAEDETIAAVETGEDLAVKMAEYEADPNVESVQPNFVYTLQDEVTALAIVNDTYTSEQWYLDGSTFIRDAWDHAKTEKTVKVAVIDTGVQANHPDLSANISSESYDFVKDTSSMTDSNGHGTHVAGILAAVANNKIGIAGVSYNAELLCYRVFQVINGKEQTDSLTLTQAYMEALNDGAQIINLSLGGYGSDTIMDTVLLKAIETAEEYGTITVCAGGNDNTSRISYPSDYDACISVTATDQSNNRASFSDYNQYKDIAAPGVNILSTYKSSNYATMNGTSMASPVVAGVISLMLAANPDLTSEQVKDILYTTATDLGPPGRDDYYGHGLVNAKEAVILAKGEPAAPSKDISITGVTLNQTSLALNIGNTSTLSAAIAPSNTTYSKTITWSSSNSSVAKVDSNGKVTALKSGTATITARTVNYKSAACKITINPVSINYQTHIQDIGWQETKTDGATSGTSGQSKRLEAIKISLADQNFSGSVEYKTHVQDIGWQDWKKNNAVSGTSGLSKRLEAIRIRLTDEMAANYDIYYRVHAQNFGWMGWAKNGAPAGTAGYSYRLEAIQIKLVEKGGTAPGSTSNYYNQKNLVQYQTHVQNIGWQGLKYDGALSGTSGQAKRLEGIKINLISPAYDGAIEYQTHIQDIGWQGWKSNAAMSGTSGQSKRLEAIQIRLTGEMAANYDVYYRVHAQNFGWMGWASNGGSAGTAGYAYRLEAIQIKLVAKGGAAPGSTSNAYKSK